MVCGPNFVVNSVLKVPLCTKTKANGSCCACLKCDVELSQYAWTFESLGGHRVRKLSDSSSSSGISFDSSHPEFA